MDFRVRVLGDFVAVWLAVLVAVAALRGVAVFAEVTFVVALVAVDVIVRRRVVLFVAVVLAVSFDWVDVSDSEDESVDVTFDGS